MPLTISNKLLQDAGMTENEARTEIACRLYDAGKLSLPAGTRWAGLRRSEFEHELLQRKMPLCRPTVEDLADDLAALDRLGV